ncbi:response regulator receiver protein [Alkalidesulfovibrio alkalitolerans DSM 16529]|uniref:Response regulator receiver protein n=1 Tax=Alkalidesulfovibrio alkalitolerans DSM 16529 TaxID=1121439 RepID=S7URV5_9BACT|nr:response regulator [Alkalidesulfovibrio alkalitolerans]EPR35053.1 response regulator receiver protein [Alkalidesulfovibrio alkalitolerans DSM 16529]
MDNGSESLETVGGATAHAGGLPSQGLKSGDLARLRILVAEDDPANRFVIESILARAGFEVHVAVSGCEALERLRTAEYDLVVLDIVLPRVDGLEVLRRVRSPESHRKDLPVLIQTGRAVAADIARFTDAGCDGWIVKPYKAEALLEKILEILHARGISIER